MYIYSSTRPEETVAKQKENGPEPCIFQLLKFHLLPLLIYQVPIANYRYLLGHLEIQKDQIVLSDF